MMRLRNFAGRQIRASILNEVPQKFNGSTILNEQFYSQKIDIKSSRIYIMSSYALKTGWFAYQASSYAFLGIYNASQYVYGLPKTIQAEIDLTASKG